MKRRRVRATVKAVIELDVLDGFVGGSAFEAPSYENAVHSVGNAMLKLPGAILVSMDLQDVEYVRPIDEMRPEHLGLPRGWTP